MFLFVDYPAWITPEVIPGLPVRWYSLMYLVAFAIAFLLFNRQRRKGVIECTLDDTYSLFLYTITGLIVGRVFFQPSSITAPTTGPTLEDLLALLRGSCGYGDELPWGLVGVVVGLLIFTRKNKTSLRWETL